MKGFDAKRTLQNIAIILIGTVIALSVVAGVSLMVADTCPAC